MSKIQSVRIYVLSSDIESLDYVLIKLSQGGLPSRSVKPTWQPTGEIPSDDWMAIYISYGDYKRLVKYSKK